MSPVLAALGWDADWAAAAAAHQPLTAARVAVGHRGAVEVVDGEGTYWAEPTGKMFFGADDSRALPIVGDWVVVADAETARLGGSRAALRGILPRRTSLVRRAAGERDLPQPLVANIDVACVMTSANQDLNPRRLERYLVAIRNGGATPLLLLSKIDLIADPSAALAEMIAVADGATVIAISTASRAGLDALDEHFVPGRTAAVLGSSGVGKSTLISHLIGGTLATGPIRGGDDRGKHTTTRRELLVTPRHGVLIDTPGMRELALYEDDPEAAFADLEAIAATCRFADCRHRAEPGCAVQAAVAAGTLAAPRVAAFHKLTDERAALAKRNPSKKRR